MSTTDATTTPLTSDIRLGNNNVQQQVDEEKNDEVVHNTVHSDLNTVNSTTEMQPSSEEGTSTPSAIPNAAVISNASTQTTFEELQQQQGEGNIEPLPLDWTRLGGSTSEVMDEIEQEVRVIRYPQDVIEIDMNDTEICIVGTAGQKITHIGSNFSKTIINPNCTSIILRSHLIKSIEGLQYCTSLELLELYDNQIEKLSNLSHFDGRPGTTLKTFDISYNSIRDMTPVSNCPNLQELYLANNKIREIKGLSGLKQLRKLDLGANRIRIMDPNELCGLVNLEDLWLGKNKIEMINGLENLTKLRRLDVQSNRLLTVENLSSQCNTLEELYLSHNAITTDGASLPSGLQQKFEQLTILDLSRNQITSCVPFQHLTTLEELWLSGNQIQTFNDVQPLQNITTLETVYLEYNPIQQSEPLYRKTLAELLPSLKQIDANAIGYVPYVHTSKPAGTTVKKNSGKSIAVTEADQLRQLQETIIARAKEETFGTTNK